jgi:hypothetical protein
MVFERGPVPVPGMCTVVLNYIIVLPSFNLLKLQFHYLISTQV